MPKDEEDKDNPERPSTSARNHKLVVVGIGASAGGLNALKKFFGSVPADSEMAFVVVMHLAPDHKSHLADVLQPHVKMPVQQVTETIPIKRNHVYVIPPNANLESIDTHLRLSALAEERRERAPIDHFFRTLAASHDGTSIGVVLTGSGSDGALGIREVKRNGGLTIVQDPSEAEYDSMPQSAIATGWVDLVLPIEEIPDAILSFKDTSPRLSPVESEQDAAEETRQVLQRIFAHVRAGTGRDFSRYKRSTILRRIARRMQLRQIEDISGYLEFMLEHSEEAHSLADDVLITVTSFFRDPEVFSKIESELLPEIFARKHSQC